LGSFAIAAKSAFFVSAMPVPPCESTRPRARGREAIDARWCLLIRSGVTSGHGASSQAAVLCCPLGCEGTRSLSRDDELTKLQTLPLGPDCLSLIGRCDPSPHRTRWVGGHVSHTLESILVRRASHSRRDTVNSRGSRCGCRTMSSLPPLVIVRYSFGHRDGDSRSGGRYRTRA
jgi:hypothetical protein